MLRKGSIALVVVGVMIGAWAWAATTFQLQTKLATIGGTLQVRNKAPQTVAGTTVYANFTTSANVPVVVTAQTGYEIASINRSGILTSYAAGAGPATYNTDFVKSAGTIQSLVASFRATTGGGGGGFTRNWQLQTKLNTVGGTMTVAKAGYPNPTTVGVVTYKNYTTSAVIPVTVAANTGYYVSGINVSGTFTSYTAASKRPASVPIANINDLAKTTNSVVASFAPNKYLITTTPGTGGTMSPMNPQISYGQTVVITVAPSTASGIVSAITPAAGGNVSYLDTNNAPVTLPYAGNVKVQITNVTAPQTVTATFSTMAVNAGADQFAAVGQTVTLKGTAANYDSLLWTQDSGPAATLSDATVLQPTFTAAAGTYYFTLRATRGAVTITDQVKITVSTSIVDSMRSSCQGCHTGNGKSYQLFENWSTSSHRASNITCITCHTEWNHSNPAPFGAGTTGGCQACHTPGAIWSIYNADLSGKAPHFPPYTSSRAQFDAQAYFTQPKVATSATCGDCHGHNNLVNAEWAEGGHGSVTAAPWVSNSSHIWLDQGPATNGVNFQNSPQQTNCIRCHTAQGFKAFVDSGFQTIDRIKDVNGSSVKLSAPLTCNACHTNPDGGLRLANFTTASHGTKGFKAFWGYSNATISGKKVVTSIQLGDNRNSNICMPCHSQRASGQEIKDVFATGSFKQYSAGTAIYPHEAQPAAIFYGKGGYEFTSSGSGATFSYQDRARHQRIGNYVAGGATGYNDTGITAGSCAGCHMTGPAPHNLEALSKDLGGNYTAIVSSECAKCHPAEFTYQDVQGAKDNFNALVKALGNALVAKGLTLDGVTPVGERKALDMSLGAKDNAVAQVNMGAWFNWYLFSTADKAAFAHNPSYARRLLTDSIDMLDDGVLNNSATATIQAQVTAGTLTVAEKNAAIASTQEPGCLGCHFGTGTNNLNGELIPGVETAPHFNTAGTLVPGQSFTQAQFVVPGAQCNNCHGYGHGTDSPSYSAAKTAFPNISSVQGKGILKNYGESAHGDINGLAWTDYNFLNLSSRSVCTPCHTTAGFVNGINAANANAGKFTTPAFIGDANETSKQVLGCNACHSSTSWKTSVRTLSTGYVAGMGGFGLSQPAYITYPNVGESNVCIPCHASRENGASIGTLADPTSAAFKNPHYLAAAAVFYGKGGFQFYTSGVRYNTYGAAGKEGRTANWSHGRLGMDNYTTTTNATVKASGVVYGSGNKGQCVACHLGPTNTHTFGALETAVATQGTSTYTRGCYGCHNGTDMSMAEFIEEEKVIWDRMFDFFQWQLEQFGIYYNDAKNPYFFSDAGTTTNLINWQVVTPVGGTPEKTMGSAMNLKLLKAEKGSFVHNRSFGRALIADSIVYLQNGTEGDRTTFATNPNGIINFSAYSTARPTDPSGKGVSISTLKSYLTKAASNPVVGQPDGYVRR